MSESDQPAVHAQDRERVDPEERIRPMPILPAVIAVGMVLFGIIYIINSGPYTNPALGDHRTLADLRPQAAGGGAGGGAVDGGAIFAANCVACHQATGAEQNADKALMRNTACNPALFAREPRRGVPIPIVRS